MTNHAPRPLLSDSARYVTEKKASVISGFKSLKIWGREEKKEAQCVVFKRRVVTPPFQKKKKLKRTAVS